ncbi:MAG: hypothetical protein IJB79_02660 [Candidatus Gastranaerophilales bacterium]|nr:hypothetical protein [Candidatus Gastranaerophilales bacterium]
MGVEFFSNNYSAGNGSDTGLIRMSEKPQATGYEELVFGAEGMGSDATTTSQIGLDELEAFNMSIESCSSKSTWDDVFDEKRQNFPSLLKTKYYGDVWHTSPTTFEVVRGEYESGHPYTDKYEFDEQPTCIEDKNGNFVYTGTMNGAKVEMITKNNKIVSVKYYSDDNKPKGIITYDQATGDKNMQEFYEDGKTLKSSYTRHIDASSTETNYHKNGNMHEKHSYDKDNQCFFSEYRREDGTLSRLCFKSEKFDFFVPNHFDQVPYSDGEKYVTIFDNRDTEFIIHNDGSYTVMTGGKTYRFDKEGLPVEE